MKKVDGIEEVAKGSKNVYGFISTDCSEVDAYLSEFGYQKTDALCFICPKTGVEIDSDDISLEDSQRWEREIGFPSMSKIDIYSNGSGKFVSALVDILNLFKEERQNIAFVNESGTKVYTRPSEFYR